MSRARDIADIGEDVTSLATDAELSSGLAEKLPYSYGTATPTTSDSGFLWYDSNSTPPVVKYWNGSAFDDLSAPPSSATNAVNSTQSTTSTSYTDLATAGPAVTITTGTKALVVMTSKGTSTSGQCLHAFAVSGASTVAASDVQSLGGNIASSNAPHLQMSAVYLVTGLTPGSNTFTMKYRVTAGTGTYLNRSITVLDMGS